MQKNFLDRCFYILLLLPLTFSTACSWLPWVKDKAIDPSAQNIQVIKVPDHLNTPVFEDLFPIPMVENKTPGEITNKKADLDLPKPLKKYPDEKQSKDQTVSLLAQTREETSSEKVQLKEQGGVVALYLNQSFNYAWSALSDALLEADFPVSDIDRSKGQFYLELYTKVEKSKLYKKLENKELLNSSSSLNILVLQINSHNDGTVAMLFNEKKEPIDKKISNYILEQLKENLR